jgi:hypothetical protein
MATIGTVVNLLDWAKQTDPDGKPARLINLMAKVNPIIEDAPVMEGNLPTGHQTSAIVALPTSTWRKFNYGVQDSKGSIIQVVDTIGMLEQYAKVDVDVANLNGNSAEFMLRQSKMHIEAMNQDFCSTLFYGDTDQYPERFLGFSQRYLDLLAAGYIGDNNVLTAGGSGSDLSSIWLVGWGEDTVHLIFPKGHSSVGLTIKDLGEQLVADTAGGHYLARVIHYKWDTGLVVANWKYVVRIGNIETAIATTGATSNSLTSVNLMIQAMNKIPNLSACKPVFYCSGNIKTQFDIYASTKANAFYQAQNPFGQPQTMFMGIPVKKCDSILNTEDALS